MSEYITENELIKRLKISRGTARKWGREIGARRVVCGVIRYDLDIVNEALDKSRDGRTGRGRDAKDL